MTMTETHEQANEQAIDPETGELVSAAIPPAAEGEATGDRVPPPDPPVPPGGLDAVTALAQASVLRRAGAASPVRQHRYLMDAMADEWTEAAKAMGDALEYEGVPGVIELAGSVVRGMKHYDTAAGWLRISRVIKRDGDWSLVSVITSPDQLQATGNKREIYTNLLGAESPVVVMG